MEDKEGRKERHRVESLVSEAPNLQTALAFSSSFFFVLVKGSRQVTSRFGVGIVKVLYEVGIVKPRVRFVQHL